MKNLFLILIFSLATTSVFAGDVGEACLSCVGIVDSPKHEIAHKHRAVVHHRVVRPVVKKEG